MTFGLKKDKEKLLMEKLGENWDQILCILQRSKISKIWLLRKRFPKVIIHWKD
jgi:hypothetical protein